MVKLRAAIPITGLVVLILAASFSSADPAKPDTGYLWPTTISYETADKCTSAGQAAALRVKEVLEAAERLKLDDLIAKYSKEVNAEDTAINHFTLGYARYARSDYDYYKLFGGHERLEDLEAVAPEFKRAIELDPEMDEARIALAAFYSERNPAAAIDLMKGLLKETPTNAEAMYWIAYSYSVSSSNKADKRFCPDPLMRITWLEQCVRTCDNWLRPRRELAQAYRIQGEQKTPEGVWVVVEPWRGKAIAAYEGIIQHADPVKDAAAIAGARKRLAELKQAK